MSRIEPIRFEKQIHPVGKMDVRRPNRRWKMAFYDNRTSSNLGLKVEEENDNTNLK